MIVSTRFGETMQGAQQTKTMRTCIIVGANNKKEEILYTSLITKISLIVQYQVSLGLANIEAWDTLEHFHICFCAADTPIGQWF